MNPLNLWQYSDMNSSYISKLHSSRHEEQIDLPECLLQFRPEWFFLPCGIPKKNINVKVYMTLCWPFVLYVDEASSLALREKHWLSFICGWSFVSRTEGETLAEFYMWMKLRLALREKHWLSFICGWSFVSRTERETLAEFSRTGCWENFFA
jgi:hypothetical protein